MGSARANLALASPNQPWRPGWRTSWLDSWFSPAVAQPAPPCALMASRSAKRRQSLTRPDASCLEESTNTKKGSSFPFTRTKSARSKTQGARAVHRIYRYLEAKHARWRGAKPSASLETVPDANENAAPHQQRDLSVLRPSFLQAGGRPGAQARSTGIIDGWQSADLDQV